MKNIKIIRLTIENFKCHRLLNLVFDGDPVSIFGDNATGKTSIYDALTWLLFGKDSQGNGEKNIEIKPLDADGQVADHKAITSVEAVLQVSGEEVVLKRTYKEVWSTRRGSSKETYDGNTSEYYVDGVPYKKYAYDAKIEELVPEEIFRLLTSVSYFPGALTWQKRREVLFDMVGSMSDREIMATDSRFDALSEGMGKRSLEDYKKALASERKKFVGAKTEVPARISECQKTIDQLAGLDFAAAKEKAAALEAEQEGIATRLLAIEHDNAIEQKRLEISHAQMELRNLDAENDLFRRSQTAGASNTDRLKREVMMLQNRLENAKTLMDGAIRSLDNYDRQINASRERWIEINSEVFTGGSCPSCGQTLPPEKLNAAVAQFEARKKKRLEETERIAGDQKMAKAQTEAQIRQYREDISQMEEHIKQLQTDITSAESAAIVPVDMDGYADRYAALKSQISKLSGELFELTQNTASVKDALRNELAVIKAERTAQLSVVSKEAILDFSRERIEELRQDAKNAAEALEAIEGMLFLVDEYSRYKAGFVEDSINGLFRIARFRLFREQANGGLEDRCDVVYDGVPYTGLNNGMKVNVGIDIINALSRHYGVTVPLFVDNAEAVTRLEPCNAQVIRLVVSEEDKELRIV